MFTDRPYISKPTLLPTGWLGPFSSLDLYLIAFAVSVTAFVTHYFLGSKLPQLSLVLNIASFVTCGFAWLLSRALFRVKNHQEIWPQIIVAILFLLSLTLYLFGRNNGGGLLGYIADIQALLGSAMLIMILIEAVDSAGQPQAERRFRLYFSLGYLTILAFSFVASLPEFEIWQSSIQVGLATLALTGACGAVWFRKQHPLEQPSQRKAWKMPSRVKPNPVLASRITNLLEEDQVFRSPKLKVSHVAERLQRPEYKISQCIVTDLGYSNFNQLINSYRVEDAKWRLSSPEFDNCSILVISMDCGFGSLGPFNRAFKADTGLTPSEFRALRIA